jgi:mannose-1-phosphate guanylyltransferase
MVEELGDGSRWGVHITWVQEPEPRGTAGALKIAEEHLDGRFLMLNGDVLTDLDLTAQIAQHERTGAVGTLALVPVEDPTAYGLVRLHGDGRVDEFLEKPDPDEIDTDLISAGAYVLERSVLDMIEPDRMVSIEREIWPRLVGDGLYGCVHRGKYWMDIGTPQRYLEGTADILAGHVHTRVTERLAGGAVDPSAAVDPSVAIADAVLVDAGATVGARSTIGTGSVVGPDVVIGEDVILENAVVLRGARIETGARLRDCIVGERVVIEHDVHVSDHAMVGDGARIGSSNVLARGIRVAPDAVLPPGALRF